MHLLVTRPTDDGEATARKLREMGHEVFLEPLLKIEFFDPPMFNAEKVQALAITSANGIRALAAGGLREGYKEISVMAIGEASANAARQSGFEKVLIGGGTLPALARDIASRFKPENGKILYLAGRARSGDLAGLLGKNGFQAETITLYDAKRASSFSDELQAQIRGNKIDGVLHFSARTAGIFSDLIHSEKLENKALSMDHFCLSQQVASNLGVDISNPATTHIAKEPTVDSLLACVGEIPK